MVSSQGKRWRGTKKPAYSTRVRYAEAVQLDVAKGRLRPGIWKSGSAFKNGNGVFFSKMDRVKGVLTSEHLKKCECKSTDA
ncbi:hypothetical protein EYF80_016088 [Liparis tanakae]|uniref:Uncharacterized protein n=1 Tax=Liparis tanakae TaxID=230148 RepID=A0A4Z2I6Y6_9TELE|nr:hypothetical protein EYF80_016088 [Liparis tanakae]